MGGIAIWSPIASRSGRTPAFGSAIVSMDRLLRARCVRQDLSSPRLVHAKQPTHLPILGWMYVVPLPGSCTCACMLCLGRAQERGEDERPASLPAHHTSVLTPCTAGCAIGDPLSWFGTSRLTYKLVSGVVPPLGSTTGRGDMISPIFHVRYLYGLAYVAP